jgi:hypothetical protein
MHKIIIAAVVLTPLAVQAAAPHWTILRQECWKLSPTAGQCAVGLFGRYDSRAQCIAANGGQLEQKGMQEGRQQAQRCEMLLE